MKTRCTNQAIRRGQNSVGNTHRSLDEGGPTGIRTQALPTSRDALTNLELDSTYVNMWAHWDSDPGHPA